MNIDLEDILTNSHVILLIREGGCCYSEEIGCNCGWQGSPASYGLHLLSVLGLEQSIFDGWEFNKQSVLREIEITDLQREEYLNIYRDPKKKRKFSKEERKSMGYRTSTTP